jgi:EmrB/QacA subfamily drug resistance transporter
VEGFPYPLCIGFRNCWCGIPEFASSTSREDRKIDISDEEELLCNRPPCVPEGQHNQPLFLKGEQYSMATTQNQEPSYAGVEGTHRVDEETPLLQGQLPSNQDDAAIGAETIIIPDEPSNRRLCIVMGSIWVGVFLGALDSTVIATLSAPISTSFNSLSLLSWLATAYLIACAACQPISGRLTDIFSRRIGLVVSNILFAAGNLMCGLATSEWTMIAGRVVAGMGGGGLMAISTFVGSDLVPLRKRGLVQGLGNVCYGTGAGLGGLFGGWVNDNWGWRMAFLVQVPFVIVSAILVWFFVDVPAKQSTKSKLSRIDFLGVFTLVVFLLLLLLGLNSGGNVVPWSHPLVLTTLPLSLVAFVAFIYVEAYLAKEPVIPVRLLLNRTVAAACSCNFFTTGVTFMVLFYIPIFFQVKGLSTTQAGIRLIPQSIGSSVGSLGSGIIMNHTGQYKILGMALISMFVLGTAMLSTLGLELQEWPAFIYLAMIGMGYGGLLTVTLLATISAVDHEHQAVITSATYLFRSTGSTIGVTVASAVYQNVLKIELWEKFGGEKHAAKIIKQIRDNFDELNRLPIGWKAGVLDSYMDALRAVFLTALGMGIVGLICGSFMRQHVLHSTLARK